MRGGRDGGGAWRGARREKWKGEVRGGVVSGEISPPSSTLATLLFEVVRGGRNILWAFLRIMCTGSGHPRKNSKSKRAHDGFDDRFVTHTNLPFTNLAN